MKKYSKEEKATLVVSAFKDDPAAKNLYVTDEGTVLNEEQYQARADKKGCDTFVNPNLKTAAATADPEAAAKLEKAEKEIARLNELKSVKDAKELMAKKDAEIESLKKQVEALTPKP